MVELQIFTAEHEVLTSPVADRLENLDVTIQRSPNAPSEIFGETQECRELREQYEWVNDLRWLTLRKFEHLETSDLRVLAGRGAVREAFDATFDVHDIKMQKIEQSGTDDRIEVLIPFRDVATVRAGITSAGFGLFVMPGTSAGHLARMRLGELLLQKKRGALTRLWLQTPEVAQLEAMDKDHDDAVWAQTHHRADDQDSTVTLQGNHVLRSSVQGTLAPQRVRRSKWLSRRLGGDVTVNGKDGSVNGHDSSRNEVCKYIEDFVLPRIVDMRGGFYPLQSNPYL